MRQNRVGGDGVERESWRLENYDSEYHNGRFKSFQKDPKQQTMSEKEIQADLSRLRLRNKNNELLAQNAWLQAKNKTFESNSQELKNIKSTRSYKFLRAIGLF